MDAAEEEIEARGKHEEAVAGANVCVVRAQTQIGVDLFQDCGEEDVARLEEGERGSGMDESE